MNRIEIKKKAKEMMEGNKWYIWKPVVIYSLIISAISGVIGGFGGGTGENTVNVFLVLSSIFSGAAWMLFYVGYAHYMLEFVRGNRMEWDAIFKYVKEHWVNAILVSLVAGVFTGLGYVLLVIPGIIIALGLSFYKEVLVDNPELSVMDVIKKAWNLTNGHKMELFVFGLSFLGWAILALFTLGIGYIWLYPYMTIALTLAYEELRKAA